jgi:hypothetical protein
MGTLRRTNEVYCAFYTARIKCLLCLKPERKPARRNLVAKATCAMHDLPFFSVTWPPALHKTPKTTSNATDMLIAENAYYREVAVTKLDLAPINVQWPCAWLFAPGKRRWGGGNRGGQEPRKTEQIFISWSYRTRKFAALPFFSGRRPPPGPFFYKNQFAAKSKEDTGSRATPRCTSGACVAASCGSLGDPPRTLGRGWGRPCCCFLSSCRRRQRRFTAQARANIAISLFRSQIEVLSRDAEMHACANLEFPTFSNLKSYYFWVVGAGLLQLYIKKGGSNKINPRKNDPSNIKHKARRQIKKKEKASERII